MENNEKDELLDIVTFCANNLRYFTADHINLLISYSGIEIEKSAVSAAISKAKGLGLIKKTNKARLSDTFGFSSIARWEWKSLTGPKKGGNL